MLRIGKCIDHKLDNLPSQHPMFLRPVNGSLEAMQPKEKLVSKRDFDRSISGKTKSMKNESQFFIPKAKYNSILGQVKSAKNKKSSEIHSRLAQLVKKYDVITSEGVERLAVPNSTKQLIYIAKDELFSVISKAHIDTDHGKLPAMTKNLKSRYKNVSNEAVKAYIRLCQGCKSRASLKRSSLKEDESKENVETESRPTTQTRGRKKLVEETAADPSEKPKRKYTKKQTPSEGPKIPAKSKTPKNPKNAKRFRNTPENASTRPKTAGTRTPQRIDFIEMMQCKDYDYNYIVVLRESSTKFVHLRPLKSHDPQELAEILFQIFVCFGTPSVLSTSNPDFISSSLGCLFSKYTNIPEDIDVEPSGDTQFFADIETLMLSWVCSNTNERWVTGLRFIQYIANLTYNKEIDKTPFEAMFGRKGKLDVSTLNLPAELLHGIRPEEDEEEIRDVEINEMLEVVMNDEG